MHGYNPVLSDVKLYSLAKARSLCVFISSGSQSYTDKIVKMCILLKGLKVNDQMILHLILQNFKSTENERNEFIKSFFKIREKCRGAVCLARWGQGRYYLSTSRPTSSSLDTEQRSPYFLLVSQFCWNTHTYTQECFFYEMQWCFTSPHSMTDPESTLAQRGSTVT